MSATALATAVPAEAVHQANEPAPLRDVRFVMRRLGGVGRETVERLMASGDLPYIDIATHTNPGASRVHRRLRFTDADIETLLERRRHAANPRPQQTDSDDEPRREPIRAPRTSAPLQLKGAERYR